MKKSHRITVISILICMLLTFSGCDALTTNYKEIEQLLVIRTLGLDRLDGKILLSLASSAEESSGVRRLHAQGNSISTTMERAYNYSYEEELFCYHVDHILIGEKAAADGIEDYLLYVCRSPIMRIDVPLFIVRNATAAEAVMEVGESGEGITEVISSVHERLENRGDTEVFTCSDVVQALARYGSALVCAIDYGNSSEQSDGKAATGSTGGNSTSSEKVDSEGSGKTVAAAGYGIVRGDKLCGFIAPDAAVAVGLMINKSGVCDIEVYDRQGQLVVLRMEDGSSTVTPAWSAAGQLTQLQVNINVKASVLELSGGVGGNDDEYNDLLVSCLEQQLTKRANAVLSSSRSLKADFLGLAGRVEKASPRQYSAMNTEFAELLDALPITVTVSGELSHTNDLKEEQGP